MKNNDIILSKQEIERLCEAYLDCRLSVFEETELEFLLGNSEYSSPVINEVRILMGIQSSFTKRAKTSTFHKKQYLWRKLNISLRVAASAAIILVSAFAIYFGISAADSFSSDSVYIAYAGGQRLNENQTLAQIEADMKEAEAFMNHIAEVEALEQTKIDNFFNLK
ncbi:MAG: hypothetical protein K2J15_01340 [Muribaculaceae bacterium]|nr:hypothetical protein [Muribaculaceae bacterium]